MSKGQSLQDPYLNALRRERTPVSVYLVNGIKLQGQIESFDQFVIVLRNSVSQMVYKHAISTVVPSRNVRLPHGSLRRPRIGCRVRPVGATLSCPPGARYARSTRTCLAGAVARCDLGLRQGLAIRRWLVPCAAIP